MLRAIAEEISLRLVANKIITIENREFYIYGIELVLNDIFILAAVALIAVLSGTVVPSFAYVVVFCSLRSYVGGYHCKTFLRCFCTSVSLYLSMVLLNFLVPDLKFIISCIIMAISVPLILVFSPVDYGNASASEAEMKKFRVLSIVLTSTASAAYVVFCFFFSDISFAISWAVFAVFILMALSLVKKKERIEAKNDDEKTDA